MAFKKGIILINGRSYPKFITECNTRIKEIKSLYIITAFDIFVSDRLFRAFIKFNVILK